MDLEQLRAFLAVVESGSFLTAARILRLSRATLRRRIDELEASAGVPLLDRTRQGAEVTAAGAVLAARGRQIIRETSALLKSVRDVGAEPAGVLRVMLPVGLPPHLLTPMFILLRTRYPRLSYSVRLSDNPVGGLLDDIDMAVHFGVHSPEGPWLIFELLRVRVWLVATAAYLGQHGMPRTIQDLGNHALLSWEAPGIDPLHWPLLQGGTFPVEPALVAPDIHFLRQVALADRGIALVPDAMVPDPGVPPATLVPVLPDLVGSEVVVRLVVPSALADLPKIKALVDQIRPYAAKLPTA